MAEVMVMPSLEEPVIPADREDFTAEQGIIQGILDDTAAQAAASGEVESGLADYDPPNPNPVPQYIPRFDITVPIDERVTLLEEPDGTVEMREPEPPEFTNPNDPVSPQMTSEAVGAGPAYPDGVLYTPPDPLWSSGPELPPAEPPAPAPAP